MLANLGNMTLGEVAGWIAVVVTAASGIIQFSPIKINPWTWIAKSIGRAVNGEVLKEVESIKTDMDTIKTEVQDLKKDVAKMQELSDEREARYARRSILRFSDEILHGILHSKEHYDETLMIITDYETYCKSHENFKNQMVNSAINVITTKYNSHLENKDFLQ